MLLGARARQDAALRLEDVMGGFARAEREALADALLEAGPQGPTLCAGWTAADLAAHLVIRDARPDAALGIILRPAARWTARVQTAVRDRTPFAQLVERVRTGPPIWSPLRIGPLDAAANTQEFFIHHEDVRRGGPRWEPRKLDELFADELWTHLRRSARFSFRPAPVGVTLVCTAAPGQPRRTVVAKPATPQMVTVTGEVGELLLFAAGRKDAARVEVTGDGAAVAGLRNAKLGV
jgi:uncharacterized protein (TIGR03085 family)